MGLAATTERSADQRAIDVATIEGDRRVRSKDTAFHADTFKRQSRRLIEIVHDATAADTIEEEAEVSHLALSAVDVDNDHRAGRRVDGEGISDGQITA
jgi:hypothetical protein